MICSLEETTFNVDDALRAAAVNSSHSTSRALSKWLRRGVRLQTDGFVRRPLAELAAVAGAPDDPLVAIHMVLQGDIQGDVLLALPEHAALALAEMLTDSPPGSITEFGEFERSCLQETGNIVGTSFANSLSQWLNLSVVPAAPWLVHDLACAALQPLLTQAALEGDSGWLSQTIFELENRRLDWSLMLMLPANALEAARTRCRGSDVRRNGLHAVSVNAAFHASRAISKWLKRGVRLTTDGFTRLPLRESHAAFASDEPVVALHMRLTRQLHGHVLLVLQPEDALELTAILTGAPPPTESTELSELTRSCLQETANILATSFANSLAKWLELESAPTAPELHVDMPQALFESLLGAQAAVADDVLVTKAVFRVEQRTLECALFVLPDPDSYRLIETFCR